MVTVTPRPVRDAQLDMAGHLEKLARQATDDHRLATPERHVVPPRTQRLGRYGEGPARCDADLDVR
jgi:hypothetical protein